MNACTGEPGIASPDGQARNCAVQASPVYGYSRPFQGYPGIKAAGCESTT